MQPVSSFFKEENDIFYLRGLRKGRIEEKARFVERLLATNRCTVSEIAGYASVTEDFVKEIQRQQQSSNQ